MKKAIAAAIIKLFEGKFILFIIWSFEKRANLIVTDTAIKI
jgi:hypothetical protein